CVTNPGTREPSVTASSLAVLDEISDGRMDLGIGRVDSARRVLGKPPITMANTEEAIRVIRTLVAGGSITYEGTDLVFPWTRRWNLAAWVAGGARLDPAGVGRGVRADGDRDDRTGRRRDHPPARGPRPGALVRRAGTGRGGGRGTRTRFGQGAIRRTGTCRSARCRT